MGASDSIEKQSTQSAQTEGKPKLKMCCACPDTKKIRDACVLEKGEDHCSKEIKSHIDCLRKEGFDV